jgi:hypothetical protein
VRGARSGNSLGSYALGEPVDGRQGLTVLRDGGQGQEPEYSRKGKAHRV